MTIMVVLPLCVVLTRTSTILWLAVRLSVLAGLLVKMIVGRMVSVWVTVTCRTRLLSTLLGCREVSRCKFSCLSYSTVVLTVEWQLVLLSTTGNVTPLIVGNLGNSRLDRNMKLNVLWCSPAWLVLSTVARPVFRKAIAFDAGWTTLVSVRSSADPLELDGFTMVIALLGVKLKPMRPSVSARMVGTVRLALLVVHGRGLLALVFCGTMLAISRLVRIWVTFVAQLTIRLWVLTIGAYDRDWVWDRDRDAVAPTFLRPCRWYVIGYWVVARVPW